jgi:hypothetical protein
MQISIKIYLKQCEYVISAIKGNGWETIIAYDYNINVQHIYILWAYVVMTKKKSEKAVLFWHFDYFKCNILIRLEQ